MKVFHVETTPGGKVRYYFCGVRVWSVRRRPRVPILDAVYSVSVEKFHDICKERNRLTTLIMGSSHAYFGYQAAGHEYNAAEISCDAYYMHKIFVKLINRGMPSLRRLIIFYEIFLPGNRTDRSSDAYRAIPWKELYKIPSSVWNVRQDTRIGYTYRQCRRYFRREWLRVDSGATELRHGNPVVFCPLSRIDPVWRAGMHERLSRGHEVRHLKALIALAQANGIRVTLVMPPMRADFRRHVTQVSLKVFESGAALARQGVQWLNFYSDGRFENSDFMDTDHLNEAGAAKLTGMIRERMNI